jgi:hypothetical protein
MTDLNGQIAEEFAFEYSGVVYAVRLFARNGEASVVSSSPPTVVAYFEPQAPMTVTSAGSISFSVDFPKNSIAAASFNIIETVRHGRQWADAWLGPGPHEPLGTANVALSDLFSDITGTSYYYPLGDSLVIVEDDWFDDFTILHEYAHYVQEQVSSFAWIPSVHYPCHAYRPILNDNIDSPELAWLEGFADWFAVAVKNVQEGLYFAPGNIAAAPEDPSAYCSDDTPGEKVQAWVGGALWDLTDTNNEAGPGGFDALQNLEAAIMAITDSDSGMDKYGYSPTIRDFEKAWITFGFPSGLTSVLGLNRISRPITPTKPAPADPICMRKPWTPGC